VPRLLKLTTAVVSSLLVAACADANKVPAETAVKAAEAAVATLSAEATRYAPGAVASVQKNLAAAKDLIAKQDYKGALDKAKGIPMEVQQVGTVVADAKYAELVKVWDRSVADLRSMTTAIKSRLDALAQAKKLPAGITKDALAAAKDGLKAVESSARKLADDFKAGKATEAVAGGRELVAKCGQIMKSIGLPPPESAALMLK